MTEEDIPYYFSSSHLETYCCKEKKLLVQGPLFYMVRVPSSQGLEKKIGSDAVKEAKSSVLSGLSSPEFGTIFGKDIDETMAKVLFQPSQYGAPADS